MLSSRESFDGKRKKFIFKAFIDFKPVKIFDHRGGVKECGSFYYSKRKRVLNLLKRFWKIVVEREREREREREL